MGASESKVIFSQKFPDAHPEAMLKKAEELSRAVPADQKIPIPPFEDMLRKMEEKYTYKPKPDAEKAALAFISLAIAVCRNFEIDTEITKREYEINVTMDLDYGWYAGDIKRPFAALLSLADEFSLTCHEDIPDCVRVSMSYHTHDIYVYGKKRDWW